MSVHTGQVLYDAPRALTTVLDEAAAMLTAKATTALQNLQASEVRLQTALTAAETWAPNNPRPIAALRRNLAAVREGIRRLQDEEFMVRARKVREPYVQRWHALQAKERARRALDAQEALTAPTRYLPTAPNRGADAPPLTVVPTSAGACLRAAGPSAVVGATTAANGAPIPAPRAPLQPVGTLAGFVVASHRNHVAELTQEARYALGLRRRPVDTVAFDTCSKCKAPMRYNPYTQQLVCTTQGCERWKQFPDMTSAALPYGVEMEFNKYAYKAVTHLDDVMKYAEGAEGHVVPPEDLEKVMKQLRARRIRPEQLTIPLVRFVMSEIPKPEKGTLKPDYTVQVFSRLSGRAPRRMTPYMKDQVRILFHAMEPAYRKHCRGRLNHLSFTYLLYKFFELLGYWEFLEALPLLRAHNLALHDSIWKDVCAEMGWQFIPTVPATVRKTAAVVTAHTKLSGAAGPAAVTAASAASAMQE